MCWVPYIFGVSVPCSKGLVTYRVKWNRMLSVTGCLHAFGNGWKHPSTKCTYIWGKDLVARADFLVAMVIRFRPVLIYTLLDHTRTPCNHDLIAIYPICNSLGWEPRSGGDCREQVSLYVDWHILIMQICNSILCLLAVSWGRLLHLYQEGTIKFTNSSQTWAISILSSWSEGVNGTYLSSHNSLFV